MSKTDWENYAININGNWQLCANCQPDSAGKKLFRQYNFWRTLLGLGLRTTPVENTAYAETPSITVQFFDYLTASPFCLYFDSNIPQNTYLWAQIGAILTNPFLLVKPGDEFGFYTKTTPTFLFYKMLIDSNPATACICNTDGAPGLKILISVVVVS